MNVASVAPCSAEAFADLMADVPPAMRAMLETGPMWFWTTDADHRFTGISDHIFRITGADSTDYLGRSRMDFIVGLTAYTPEGEAHIECLKAHEPFRDFTYRHTFNGTRESWISASGDPVFDECGEFCGYRGVAMVLSGVLEQADNSLRSERDLLARTAELQRRVEARTEALDHSYRLLSEVLQCMDQGLLVYDVGHDGNLDIVLTNQRFAELMALPQNMARAGRSLTEIMDFCEARGDFDGLESGRATVRKAAEAAMPIFLRPAGTGRTILYNTKRRSGTGAVVTLTDVTDLEKQRTALDRARQSAQEANHLLTEVVDAMGEGLLVTGGTRLSDEDKPVLLVNPAYRRLFDITEDQLRPGSMIRDFLALLETRGDATPRDEFLEIEARLDAGEQVMMHIPSNGRSYYVRATKRPSGGFVLVHTDVTDLQARNLQLEQARRAADLASQAKSDFLAAMSHEIRTPMNGIIGMAELLVEGDLPTKQKMFARTILESAGALTDVIGDVLDFSKIEAGKMTLTPGPVDLVALVRDVRMLLAQRAEQAGIHLRLDVSPDMPRLWVGDGTRLRQILINLTGNAIKFTHQGQVTIRMKQAANGGVTLAVEDTGIGIPEGRLDSIFKAFEQVLGEDGRHYGGTGLGLEITRRLVGLMGGTLEVRSEVGRGSVFTADLPLERAEPAEPERAEMPRDAVPGRGAGACHILVAEDNRTNQLVLKHMLASLGVRVTFCGDGVEVVEAFIAHGADLVLMDVSMPRKDGIAATRDIRQHEMEQDLPPCPVVALTGNATSQTRIQCLEAGMNGFLTKPLHKSALLAEMERLLYRHDDTPTARSG